MDTLAWRSGPESTRWYLNKTRWIPVPVHFPPGHRICELWLNCCTFGGSDESGFPDRVFRIPARRSKDTGAYTQIGITILMPDGFFNFMNFNMWIIITISGNEVELWLGRHYCYA